MENGKSLKLISLNLTLAIIILPVFCYAYSDETTHPALTNESIDVFNREYPDLFLSDIERGLILKGSKDEDSPIYRPLNHFFDPVYNVGLLNVSMSAKSWSQNTRFQAGFSNLAGIGFVKDLFGASSDYSWDRAVYDYVHGDKKRALETLGHNMHLIQDMAVPPHVRNDQHLSGVDDSPYEIFTKQFNKKSLENLSDELVDKEVVIKNSLDGYFDSMAGFTNGNFFSKDTLPKKDGSIFKYLNPNLESLVEKESILNHKKMMFGYKSVDSLMVRLLTLSREVDLSKNEIKILTSINDPGDLILTDYWNILSKQAVLHSAGVIKLFFDEVEKEKQTLALFNKNKSFFAKVGGKIAGVFSGGNSGGIDLVNSNLATVSGEISGNGGKNADGLGSWTSGVENGVVTGDENGENEAGREYFSYENRENSNDVDNSVENPVDKGWESSGLEGENLNPANQNQGEEGQNNGSEAENGENLGDNLVVNSPQNNFQAYSPGFGGGGGGSGSSVSTEETQGSSNGSTSTQTQTTNSTPTPVVVVTPDAPIITSPNSTQQASSTIHILTETIKTTSINFTGTASSTNIISTDFSNKTTVTDQNNSWQLNLENLNQGTTTINFYTSNQEQTATSTATTVEFFIDSEAPNITLEIQECQNSISQSDCLFATASKTVNASWSSLSIDLDYFILNKNGVTSTTTATTTQITISGNQIYNLGISAVDKNGNISQEETQTIQTNNMPVVINEVAWAGTSASNPNDEWIELYNNTNENINLENWTIYTEDLGIYTPLSGNIPAKGFYLLERTDDTTVSDITADLIYTGDLNNSQGEHLILALHKNNATTTIDEILKSKYWGHNSYFSQQYNSIERYDPNRTGTNWGNWFPNDGSLIKNGLDTDGNSIKGTPKAKNNINYFISVTGSVSSNKILKEENSPYIISSSGLTIDNDVILSIESGVVIKMAIGSNVSLKVNGTLQSNGTKEDPVIFTSFSDDEFGGDLNGDGFCDSNNASSTSACPYAGSWKQVLVEPTSQNSQFKNTVFRYGGYYANGQLQKYKGMVSVDNTDVLVENSVFENSKSKGLQLIDVGSSTLVSDSIFRNNTYEHPILVDYPYGLWIERGSPLVQNNIFENNRYGVALSGSSAVLNSNIFRNNSGFAVYGYSTGGFSDNSGSGNGINGIIISGNLTQDVALVTLKHNFLPYVFDYNASVSASSTLIIDPGVVLKMRDRKFEVSGRLEINGVVGNEVLLTAVSDDSDGVNVENDVQPDTILPGAHRGLYMKSGSSSEIRGAEFRYSKCGVSYENSSIYLENVTFRNNKMAICFDTNSATTTINNLIFENNTATSSNPF